MNDMRIKKIAERFKKIPKTEPPSELTTADMLVLSLLSERPMHGYELLREFDQQEVTEWARVSRPHVYYALQKLARLGFTESIPENVEPSSVRGRMIYRVSPPGKLALRKALGRSSWATASVPAPFTTWFGLSIHTGPSQRKKVLAARALFLCAEIARKRETLKFIQTYESVRAPTGIQLVRLYIDQCATELRWIRALEVEEKSFRARS